MRTPFTLKGLLVFGLISMFICISFSSAHAGAIFQNNPLNYNVSITFDEAQFSAAYPNEIADNFGGIYYDLLNAHGFSVGSMLASYPNVFTNIASIEGKGVEYSNFFFISQVDNYSLSPYDYSAAAHGGNPYAGLSVTFNFIKPVSKVGVLFQVEYATLPENLPSISINHGEFSTATALNLYGVSDGVNDGYIWLGWESPAITSFTVKINDDSIDPMFIDNLTFTSVPIPAAVWLLGSGLLGLLGLRRKIR